MSNRTAILLALVLAIFAATLYGCFVVLMLPLRNVGLAGFGGDVPLDELPIQTVNILTALAGAFLVAKRSHNPIGWLLCALGVGLLSYPFIVVLVTRLASPNMAPSTGLLWLAWVGNWSWVLAFVGIIYVLLLFPNGRLPSPRWRPVAWGAAASLIMTCISAMLYPGRIEAAPHWLNPLGMRLAAYLLQPFIFCLILFQLVAIIAIVVRFFRSRGIERQQLKWIAFGAAVHGVVVGVSMLVEPPRWMQAFGPAIILAAIVIAVMRYRLYDIDVIIRRTVIYSVLTVILAAVYIGSVVVLQRLMTPVIGRESPLAIVASTLAIAALFQPLRRRIQNVIDRRFYRRKYDSQRVLDSFAARLRNETDMEGMIHETLQVVQETLQPTHASLWLCEPGRARRR